MIRHATTHDIDDMMTLFHQAQAYFKRSHIDQWQNGYPNEEQLQSDIDRKHSYVLVEESLIGTMYFSIEDDPTYSYIEGEWKTHDQPYAVIHRIVVDENKKGRGLAKQLLEYAQTICEKEHIHSIRVDTHDDNLSMQAFLKKNGFVPCGHIYLQDGALRIAFEKLLNK